MDMENVERQAAGPVAVVDGSYMDWTAILGGAVVAVGIATVFAAFGAALGLSFISARPDEGSFDVMVLVSAVWMVISLVASYMTGGYITGRMRRRVENAAAHEIEVRDGLNGLAVWGIGIILTVTLIQGAVSTTLSAAGSTVGAAADVAGSVVGNAAQGVMDAAGQAIGSDQVGYVTSGLLRPDRVAPPGPQGAADVSGDVGAILANVARTGEVTDAEKTYLASAVAATAGIPPEAAAQRVDSAIAAAQKLRSDAEALAEDTKQAAIKAAETARIGAILTAFVVAAASLVAAGAAHLGAVKGGRHREEGRLFGGFAARRVRGV